MATGGWCGLGPLLFRKKAYGLETMKSSSSYAFSKSITKKPKLSKVARSKKSSRRKDNFVQMMELRKKILILRDIIDLPPLEGAASINELVVGTMEDLQKLYPEIISEIQYSEMKATCIEQSLAYFCTALKSIGDSWMLNHEWRDKSKYNLSSCQENSSFNEIVESVLGIIDCIVSMANERFDMMDEYVHSKDSSSYSRTSSFGKSSSSLDSCSETNSSCCSSPETPTSVLANFRNSQRKLSEKKSSEKENVSCSSPLLWSLRVQAVEKLNPIDVKHLLLPRLSHCGGNVCPVSNKATTVEESRMDMDDKLLSKEIDAAARNEEIEVSDIKEEKLDTKEEIEVSDIKEEKLDTNEEIEVGDIKEEKLETKEEIEVSDDIKEEKLELSTAASQKNIAETSDDNNSQAAETVEELPASKLPDVASEPSPLLASVLPPPPPPPPHFPQPFVVVVALQLPTPPPPPPPMMQQNPVLAPPLSRPPPPPPLPQITVLSTAAVPMAPPPPALPQITVLSTAAAPTASAPPALPQITVLPTAAAPTAPPPPPQLLNVIETVMKVAVPPPPPMVSGTTVKLVGPPPPPPTPSKGGAAASAPPPPMPLGNGCAPPPPPPGGAMRSVRSKKSSTKLKRSHQLGNLYRTLKGKVEGSNQNLKSAGRKGGVGSSTGGKQGMADALAEMTKRSAYFQQIEEDVKNHAKAITELKPSISTFQSSDMNELLKFHKHVESILEHLTDESQVLARFEGFPTKKLEAIRTAAALYLKLDAIVYNLQNWKIVSPMGQLLDRVENYFTKIKGEIDALERTKDDESKKFRSHGIQFDFNILIRIKESMVDVSSSCMELALKEKRELKAAAGKTQNRAKSERTNKGCAKMLWRAFQFAYRVYTFAGGHDERADRLTRELALEIESEPHNL